MNLYKKCIHCEARDKSCWHCDGVGFVLLIDAYDVREVVANVQSDLRSLVHELIELDMLHDFNTLESSLHELEKMFSELNAQRRS